MAASNSFEAKDIDMDESNKTYNTVRSQNSKGWGLTFDELINNVNINILLKQFESFLTFLKSPSSEISLPFVSRFCEEIFRRISLDVNILNSKCLDANYRDICNKIMSQIIKNQSEYRLSCEICVMKTKEAGVLKVLVIKKEKKKNENTTFCNNLISLTEERPNIYENNNNTQKSQSSFDISQNMMSSPNNSMYSPDSNIDPNIFSRLSINSVPMEFKLHCLHTTLAFVKSESELFIRFEDLIFDQAKYIYEMINSVLNYDEYKDMFGNRLVYTALWETVKLYKEKYDFKFEIIEFNIDKSILILEKIRKDYSTSNNKVKYTHLPELIEQANSRRITKKRVQREAQTTHMIYSLPRTFVKEHLITVQKFLAERKVGELVCQPKTMEQLTFCRKVIEWSRMIRRPKVDEELDELFDKINEELRHVKCKVPVGKKNRTYFMTGIKEVTYKSSLRDHEAEARARNKRKKALVEIPDPLESSQSKMKKTLSVEKLDKTYVKPMSRDTSAIRSSSLARRSAEPGSQQLQLPYQESSNERSRSYTSRKEQLIEALSVPVQSDKAMKMMRGMGWSGGALGARGDGITEPIMPVLDIVRGVGLGHNERNRNPIPKQIRNPTAWSHIKGRTLRTHRPKLTSNWVINSAIHVDVNDVIVQKTKELLKKDCTFDSLMKTKPILNKKNNKNHKILNDEFAMANHFITDVLTNIFELLSSDETSRTLKYKEGFGHRQKSFLKHACEGLAMGRRLRVPGNHRNFMEKVLELYKKKPGVMINGIMSNFNKDVTLTKKNISTKTQLNGTDTSEEDDDLVNKMINENINNFAEILSSIKSKKAQNSLKFNVLGLLKIISFLKSDNEEMDINFNKVLTEKQRSSFENIIEAANSRTKYGSNQIEMSLSSEIKKNIGKYFLGYIFEHKYTSITLFKYSPKYRSTGSRTKPNRLSTDVNLDNYISDGPENEDNEKDNRTKPKDNDENEQLKKEAKKESKSKNIEDMKANNDNMETAEIEYYVLHDCKETVIHSPEINKECSRMEQKVSKEPSDCIMDIDQTEVIDTVKDNIQKSLIEKEVLNEHNKNSEINALNTSDPQNECIDDLDNILDDIDFKIEDVSSEHTDDIIMVEENAETDFDKIEDLDLSEKCDNNIKKLCDTDAVDENNVCDTENDRNTPNNTLMQSIYLENSNVYLVPKDYPNDCLTKEKAVEIQKLISDNIVKTTDLPLLVCHGVQNGALIYSCHSKKTYDWLKNVVSVDTDIKMKDATGVQRMALKYYCLFNFDVSYLFKMLELYNVGLSTSQWVVENSITQEDCKVFFVKMDVFSVKYIHASDLALFAGVDKVEFCIIWD